MRSTLTTFHLFRVPPRRAGAAFLRMGLDRGPLRRTSGLQFFKLVGTGDGRTFTLRDADPTRWGLVCVWRDRADLKRFESSSPVADAWRALAAEQWRGDLVPIRTRGRWAGADPFAGAAATADHGPAAALTRARIKWSLSRRFWRAVPPVSAALQQHPGLRFAIGFGEAPIGLQGTLSLWDSDQALTRFAYETAQHRDAIRATADLGWYSEELFARFRVIGSTGTVDGRDPLAGLLPKLRDDA